MEKGIHILVVDDEPDLREILECNLENAGYTVSTAASAEEALEILTPHHSLILLDVMMSGISGYQMAKEIRTTRGYTTPIIFLTAKDAENDMLTGFSVGADDYISKPFSLQEVLARVKAVLRRSAIKSEGKHLIGENNFTLNTARKVVKIGENEIRLTPKEYGILEILMKHTGHIVSREEILNRVWKGESCVTPRTVDVHIANLRRKLAQHGDRICNRQGHGYCFE